jgi:hypothetical protein
VDFEEDYANTQRINMSLRMMDQEGEVNYRQLLQDDEENSELDEHVKS